MIQIYITKVKHATIVEVIGHANYAPKGHDIVCSAISTLFVTLHKTIKARSQRVYDLPKSAGCTPQSLISY